MQFCCFSWAYSPSCQHTITNKLIYFRFGMHMLYIILYMSLALHDKLIWKDDPAHRALRAGIPMLVQNKNVTIKKLPKQKGCTVYNLSIKHTCPTITLMTEPLQLNSKVNQFIYRSICNSKAYCAIYPKMHRVYTACIQHENDSSWGWALHIWSTKAHTQKLLIGPNGKGGSNRFSTNDKWW